MEKFFTTILATLFCSVVYAQVNIPVINGDIEDSTPMYQNIRIGNKWAIRGIWFNENSNPSKFDARNSGLAPGEGRNGSQAIKSTIINGTGTGSAHVTLSLGDNDISNYGPGTYTFTFYAKSLKATTSRPFWIVCSAIDETKNDISKQALTIVDNGGTVVWRGLDSNYLQQSATVRITDIKSVKFLRLQIQHASFTNTYWFDDFTLTKLD